MALFSLYLKEKDFVEDFCTLLEMLRLHSCLDDFSDVAIVYTGGTERLARQIRGGEGSRLIFLRLDNETGKKVMHKRFVFILLPRLFQSLMLAALPARLLSRENHFTNLIFVTRRMTKKVKNYPFFTSHLQNMRF